MERICPITKRELPEFRENAGIWDLSPKKQERGRGKTDFRLPKLGGKKRIKPNEF